MLSLKTFHDGTGGKMPCLLHVSLKKKKTFITSLNLLLYLISGVESAQAVND